MGNGERECNRLPDQRPTFDTVDEPLRVLRVSWAYRELRERVALGRAVAYVIEHLRMHDAYLPMTACQAVRWSVRAVARDFELEIEFDVRAIHQIYIQPTRHPPMLNSGVNPSKSPDYGNIEWQLPESCVLIGLALQHAPNQSHISKRWWWWQKKKRQTILKWCWHDRVNKSMNSTWNYLQNAITVDQ